MSHYDLARLDSRSGGRGYELEYGWDPVAPTSVTGPGPTAPSPPGSFIIPPDILNHQHHHHETGRRRRRLPPRSPSGSPPPPSTRSRKSLIGLPTAATVSVIGYRSEDFRSSRRDRARVRDLDNERDMERFFGIEPKRSRDRANDGLNQRMERNSAATAHISSSVSMYGSPRSHTRARSLSVPRTSSPELKMNHHRDLTVYGGGGGGDIYGRTTYHPGPGSQKPWYQHERLSLSSPRVALAGAGWPLASSRPGSRSPPKYYHPHHGHENGLRIGLQKMGLQDSLPNPRSPSQNIARKRSESFESDITEVDHSARPKIRKKVTPGGGMRSVSKFRPNKPQYNQVHCLLITWEFHDLRTEDYTAPPAPDYVSLEDETRRLRGTLEGYGYDVHEYRIPMQRSEEDMAEELKRFCRLAANDTLLMVYYHGHGSLNDDNELIFSSHDHPDNAEWSQAAAADLYSALLARDKVPRDRYDQLIKKYERYQPISSLSWSTIRDPLLSAPSDVLLVLDCCAAGGANLKHVNWQPPPNAKIYTKHLFAACGFESSTSDDMTAKMCEVLDEWIPEVMCGSEKGMNGSGGNNNGVLTTKRLHQLMEDRLQKKSAGSQPIFKQLLPHDPEQYITLPNFREMENSKMERGRRAGRVARGFVLT
ncbi:hypothetical protein QBC35DRAFT_255841 [Podospora australis]|uniref:Peptidase C14 caspase domain-containing protein n=1 Tax=Podospora australis TaxID=1536484 RepID=A0AAN6WUG9_9PEZI|nr:hypothetical protein QBC35DRAFT_255841 [Podospora australis]